MFRKTVSALFLGIALTVAGLAGLGADPALAEQCFTPSETRAMVQNRQAITLSGVLGEIRAVGQIVSSDPLLCDVGGRLVYLIDVISKGRVIHMQVDAQTGNITY